ncbi:MAG: DUF3037 domain-containing protein [Cyclobacteriaceae bacterium]
MITYQYQILRFLPDRINEEFVNLGVVVYDSENRVLKSRFIDKAGRVSTFFPDVNVSTRYLSNTLKFLQGEFFNLGNKLSLELPMDRLSDLNDLTKSILPKDDSSLIFSETKKGRDVSVEVACDDLYDRVILRNITEHDEVELRNDREVWNKVYKSYFEKHKISNRLHAHTVKTKNDSLEFERAWKNGKWNCFETVSFNLTRPDSVKNKVYKWAGKLEELGSSKEPISLYLLSVLPDNEDLKKFINRKLNNKAFDHSSVKLITEDEAESLAKKFQKEIESHS